MKLGIFGAGCAGSVISVGLAPSARTVAGIDTHPDTAAPPRDGTRIMQEPNLGQWPVFSRKTDRPQEHSPRARH